MATLLHFLRSLIATFMLVFVLAFGGIGLILGGLMFLAWSPATLLSETAYEHLSRVLVVFGGGDRFNGMLAIALTLGVVAVLLDSFRAYKRNQRSTWHMASVAFDK